MVRKGHAGSTLNAALAPKSGSSTQTKDSDCKNKDDGAGGGIGTRSSVKVQTQTAFKASSSQGLTAVELCEFDDMGTTLLIDPYLGFCTHKMNIRYDDLNQKQVVRNLTNSTIFLFFVRFKQPKIPKENLKDFIAHFLRTQDYEASFQRIVSADWMSSYYNGKTIRERKLFKQHIFRYFRMFDKNSGFEIKPCSRCVIFVVLIITKFN